MHNRLQPPRNRPLKPLTLPPSIRVVKRPRVLSVVHAHPSRRHPEAGPLQLPPPILCLNCPPLFIPPPRPRSRSTYRSRKPCLLLSIDAGRDLCSADVEYVLSRRAAAANEWRPNASPHGLRGVVNCLDSCADECSDWFAFNVSLDTWLLGVVAGTGAVSAGLTVWSFFSSRNRRKQEEELRAKQADLVKAMELDSRTRIRFVNVQRDGEVLVKFRIRNRSQSESILRWPLIGVRDYRVRTVNKVVIGIQPNCEEVIEAEIPDFNIDGIDPSEFRIVDTGFPNKV